LQISIDDQLLRQAHRATGLSSDRELVEYGLRLVIAAQSLRPSDGEHPRSRKVGKVSEYLQTSRLEPADAPSIYRGPPLSLETMDPAIQAEAARHG
jgi:hypothetical protein